MFTLSILLMALAIGLLPTYASLGIAALLLLRILQGAAIGGEVPGAWVFVAEYVPSRRIGFACGALTAGLTVGILLGSFVATLINQLLPAGGWRIPFFKSGGDIHVADLAAFRRHRGGYPDGAAVATAAARH